jgi:hypothetical protein
VAESTIAYQSVPRFFPLLSCENYPQFPALDGRNSQGICSLRITITPCRMHIESPVQTQTCLSSGFLVNGLPMKKNPKGHDDLCSRSARSDKARYDGCPRCTD